MPIYEYVCQSCQHRFEVKQSFSDAPVTGCARCGQAVTKIISASAIMFKGSGWYVTDYSDKLKPGSEPKAEEADASAQKKEGESSSGDTPATGATAPATSDSPAKTADSTATAGSGTPSTAPAAPPSPTTK